MINSILKLFKALNSDVGPWQIAFAASFALVIGLTPLWSIHNLVVLLLVFVFRIHLGTFFAFWLAFSALAFLLDPMFHQLGLTWLDNDSLNSLWTSLYQSDLMLALHFNHTITLASFVVAMVLFFPLAVVMRLSIIRYRANLMPWIDKLKVVQVVKGSRLYELYQRIDG